MSGIVYKWRITDCKFAYLTDIYGGNPFITTQIQDDARISEVVKNLDEETYATKYETLCSIINADPDGRHIQMLDYKYYFNVDDTSCGLLQYAGTYYNGPQGEKGVGILRIQTIYEVGYTIIRFYLTDNTHYDAIIKNGISGVNGLNGGDGRDGETSNVVLELESQKQDLENLREEILNAVTAEINERLKWSQDALIDFAGQLSALTNDSGYVTYVQNELLGFEEKMWGYIDKSACTKTEFYTVIAPYSGFMETIAEYVDALTSAVTIYNNRIDIAEGQLKEAMSYYDAVAGQLNEYWLKYDAVNNRLESVVSEMTGNSSVTLSEIFQTARMVGLMVSGPSGSTDINGNPLMASIIAQINDTGSTISLSATKIYLLGETVASSLTSLDLTINGGNSYFGSDGSGWIANSGISWNAAGDMVIRGQLGIGDVIEGLSETDLELAGGTNASTIFNRDGSGWLAGGNIYWDKFGTMTIKKDVRIEGVLSVDEIADGLGNSIISFGKDNSNAATVFYPDDAGSLAGGAISWDPDGSVKIAGDLTVGGSIKQEVLDYANETNLPVGGSTTEFRSDGSGYICNGAIEWDVNGNMKIDGSVTIGDIDDIDSAIEAYLNTKDLSINGGKSYFGSDGSGWLANHAIEWNSGGTLTIEGNGIFKGSFLAISQNISDDKEIYLSFDTGFNFAGCSYQKIGAADYYIFQTLYLPNDIKYNGVRCVIENTAKVSQNIEIAGESYVARAFKIKVVGGGSFRINTGGGYQEPINELEVYGMGHAELHSVIVDGSLRWVVDNADGFRRSSYVNNVLSTWRGMQNISISIFGIYELIGNTYNFARYSTIGDNYLWCTRMGKGVVKFEWEHSVTNYYVPFVMCVGHGYGWCSNKTDTEFIIETADDSSNNDITFELAVLHFIGTTQ